MDKQIFEQAIEKLVEVGKELDKEAIKTLRERWCDAGRFNKLKQLKAMVLDTISNLKNQKLGEV
jgi:hypothetical protein